MIDVEPLIAESFARLYPTPAVTARWDDVLRRAHAQRRRPALRLRLVLILVIGLLVLAGIATGTYLGVRTWVSTGPRGVQYQNDYRLATVFAARGNPVGWSPGGNPVPWWASLALSPDGHDLYAMTLPAGARAPVIVRIAGVDRGTLLRATPVFDLRNLHIANWCVWPFVRPVTVAANGDVFFVAGGADRPPTGIGCAVAGAMNDAQVIRGSPARRAGLGHLLLFVLHPDGSQQLILSGNEIVSSKLFPPDWMEWEIAASAPDRVWLAVGPLDGSGPHRLLEIVDPNTDGDWSDRVVRRIELPPGLVTSRGWLTWQLAAEPEIPRSVLAAVTDERGFRVYRITDRGGDPRLLLDRRGAGGSFAPRLVQKAGAAQPELAVAGGSLGDRVSLVSTTGAVRDVARAFRGLSAVLAGPNGVLYVVAGTWDIDQATNSLVVYRLAPAGSDKGTISVGSPVIHPATSVSFPVAGGLRLVFTASLGGKLWNGYTIAASGGGLQRLVSRVRGVCQSVDGGAVAYSSDAEVPTEFVTYVARAGARPVKVTERNDRLVCPFGRRWLVLYRPVRYRPDGSSVGDLVRHDLRTGWETVVARGIGRYALSPDTTKLVYAGRRAGRQILVVVNLATLRRRQIAAAEPHAVYSTGGGNGLGEFGAPVDEGLRWSPDGRLIAYTTELPGRTRGRWLRTLWVRDAATGRPLLRRRILGLPALLSWSPDDERLLINIGDRLLLVNVRRGSVRTVTRALLRQDLFPGWAPSGDAFAYATRSGLFVVGRDGRTRLLASTGQLGEPRDLDRWGWSPDSRFIGLGPGCTEKPPGAIQLIDVHTGRVRVLHPFAQAVYECVSWSR